MYMYISMYMPLIIISHVQCIYIKLYIIIPGTLLEIMYMYNTQFSETAVRDMYMYMYIHHVYCMYMFLNER